MPWREFDLCCSVIIPACSHLSPRREEAPRLYTTANLGWKPLVQEDPNGPQFATLWGDPSEGDFGAVVQFPMNSSGTYTLIRRTSCECSCGKDERSKASVTAEIADAIRLVTTMAV